MASRVGRRPDPLTALQVKKLSEPGYYADGGGLYLQVARGGSKSWIFKFKVAGKSREMGLGSVNTFSLAEARERAREQRQKLADGIDPIAAKREDALQRRMADANIITFNKAAEGYINAHAPGWRNDKHRQQWENTLATYASPIIGDLPVSRVDTAQVLRVLQPIWTAKAETASRLRGRIESVLDWARVQGYREGENPARWKGHLDMTLPARAKVAKVEHHAALPWREVGAFMRELQAMPGASALAVQFIILTACRTSEAINAEWREFDLIGKVWTIPAERMKAAKEHVIPLSEAALRILAELRDQSDGDYVFPGPKGKPISNMAGLALLKRMGRADLTVHGFRSTFRDWAGESTAHPREVIEHALAHQLKDKAEAAYQRGTLFEKRRVLMADWAAFCNTVPASADVVPIRQAAH
jgi:integrase